MLSGENQTSELRQGSSPEQINPTLAEVQRLLSTLPPDQQRNFIGGSFMRLFGGVLTPGTSQELQRVITTGKQSEAALSVPPKEHQSPLQRSEQSGTPEDQWIGSVSDIAFLGKFPQGIDLKGTTFLKPQLWFEDFEIKSPTGWTPNRYKAEDLWFLSYNQISGKRTFPEMGILAIAPDKQSGYSCISYTFPQDENVRDRTGRYAVNATVFLRMPSDKAIEVIQTIKTRSDGADVAERLLQKAVPGATSKDNSSPGIRRARTTELFIADEEFQREYYGEQFVTDYMQYRTSEKRRNDISQAATKFPAYVDQHPELMKSYSIPVGTGRVPVR